MYMYFCSFHNLSRVFSSLTFHTNDRPDSGKAEVLIWFSLGHWYCHHLPIVVLYYNVCSTFSVIRTA